VTVDTLNHLDEVLAELEEHLRGGRRIEARLALEAARRTVNRELAQARG